jgi:hypothetical protein
MSVGDLVGVSGTIATDQPWTIDAAIVHDWTTSPPTTTDTSVVTPPATTPDVTTPDTTTAPTAPADVTATFGALYTGTATDVSNLANSSFVLTGTDGTQYTVQVNPGATIWNTASGNIGLTDIAQGDSIRLNGTLQADGTITADVVRDTSQ